MADQRHDCDTCGKLGFKTKKSLQVHKNKCGKPAPFGCDRCTGAFWSQIDLDRHGTSQHGDPYPYNCDVCGRGFVKPTDLGKHVCGYNTVTQRRVEPARNTLPNHVPSTSRPPVIQRPCPDCKQEGTATTGTFQLLQTKQYYCRRHYDDKPNKNVASEWRTLKQATTLPSKCQCWRSVQATYGFIGAGKTCCRVCAKPGMMPHPNRLCEQDVCATPATHGTHQDENKRCSAHQQAGDINCLLTADTRTNKKSCTECWKSYQRGDIQDKTDITLANYNVTGSDAALYCRAHKPVDAVGIVRADKLCQLCDNTHAVTVASDGRKLCARCAESEGVRLGFKRRADEGAAAVSPTKHQRMVRMTVDPTDYTTFTLPAGRCSFVTLVQADDQYVCGKQASFQDPDDAAVLRCKSHALDSFISTHKMCVKCNIAPGRIRVINQALTDLHSQTVYDRHIVYCRDCAIEHNIDIDYGPTTSARCTECDKKASFGHVGMRGSRCFAHKTPDMVCVNSKPCVVCNDQSKYWGYCEIGNTANVLCHEHYIERKKNDLTSVMRLVDTLCTQCSTPTVAEYSFIGEPMTACKEHRVDGMIEGRTPTQRRCCFPDCSRMAVCGLTLNTIIHCDLHITTKERNFIERPCVSCDLSAVLSANNQCDTCDPAAHANIKRYEMAVKSLFDQHGIAYVHDRQVSGGGLCLKSRPDFCIQCDGFMLVVEVDEHAHRSYMHAIDPCDCIATYGIYQCGCDVGRMAELTQEVAQRTLFLRFNPHRIKNQDGSTLSRGVAARHDKLLMLVNSYLSGSHKPPPSMPCCALYLYYPDKSSVEYVSVDMMGAM